MGQGGDLGALREEDWKQDPLGVEGPPLLASLLGVLPLSCHLPATFQLSCWVNDHAAERKGGGSAGDLMMRSHSDFL